MCSLGKCDFLKENGDKGICWEFENCPRMLSDEDMGILLDALSVKMSDFGGRLEHFLLDAQGNVNLSNYFYMYYRKFDLLLYWADIHLGHLVDEFKAS